MEYPKPEKVKSNYLVHMPPNYYAERECIDCLLKLQFCIKRFLIVLDVLQKEWYCNIKIFELISRKSLQDAFRQKKRR